MKRPAVYVGYDSNPNSPSYQSGEMTFITSDGQFFNSAQAEYFGYYEIILPKVPSIEEAIAYAKLVESKMDELVFFFSRHTPSPLMIEHLGQEIETQFEGTISNIRGDEATIQFDETIDETKRSYRIPRNSVVVAVAPLDLQIAFLSAGVSKLLVPKTDRVVDSDGKATFTYVGLRWIKSIAIDAEDLPTRIH